MMFLHFKYLQNICLGLQWKWVCQIASVISSSRFIYAYAEKNKNKFIFFFLLLPFLWELVFCCFNGTCTLMHSWHPLITDQWKVFFQSFILAFCFGLLSFTYATTFTKHAHAVLLICLLFIGTQFKLVMCFGWHHLCHNGKWGICHPSYKKLAHCIFSFVLPPVNSKLVGRILLHFRYAALGKTRTRYLLYKDVNRNPL